MKKITILLIPLIFIAIACEKNQAPQLTSIESLTEIIVGGSEVILKVNSSDENGDSLTYNWSANGGEIISTTTSDSLVWKAPTSITEDSYTIAVEVSDGELIVEDELLVSVEGGKFIDIRDDNIYDFVQIGEQAWMAENLAYLPEISPHREGSSSEPFYYVYSFTGSSLSGALLSEYYKKYGVLYNWHAANISCPKGWHLPSDEEYKILERYLGMSKADSDSNKWDRGRGVDDKMKSVNGWSEPDLTTNVSGFNLAPAGMVRLERNFYAYGASLLSELWCSSSDKEGHHISRLFLYNSDGICKWNWPNYGGFSVRCIKD